MERMVIRSAVTALTPRCRFRLVNRRAYHRLLISKAKDARRGRVFGVAVWVLLAAACGNATEVDTTDLTMVAPQTTVVMPPGPVPVPAPDGEGPMVAVVAGWSGELATAPLMALDGQGRTLAYGTTDKLPVDLSVCPGSEKALVLGSPPSANDRSRLVLLWDLASFSAEDEWQIGAEAGLVTDLVCASRDGREALLYSPPLGPDPSRPSTTTAPIPADATGSDSTAPPASLPTVWSVWRFTEGKLALASQSIDYGQIIGLTPETVFAQHNDRLSIIDLVSPARVDFEYADDTSIQVAEHPGGSPIAVLAAGIDSATLDLYELMPTPTLTASRAVDVASYARTFLWIDDDRLLVDGQVYGPELDDLGGWENHEFYYAFVGEGQTGFGLGLRSPEQRVSVLDRVELASGKAQELRSFVGDVNYLVAVPDGLTVTSEASVYVPEPPVVWPPGSDQPSEPIPAPDLTINLPDLGAADQPLLEDLQAIVAEGEGDGDRILGAVIRLGPGDMITVSLDDIEGCSGVGYAAGATSSQPLAKSTVDNIPAIIYSFVDADKSATIAAIDPTTCEILAAVGSLLVPGPGVNITTTTLAG